MIKSLEIERNNMMIRGTVHIPEGFTGARPCLIFCHGFTANRDEPHFMFVKIARALEKIGVVSIRFDFLGSGESDGEFCDMTINTEVEDCKAVIAYAKSLEFIDENNINLLGFSKGGAVSIITATQIPDDIKNLILMSPANNMLSVYTQNIRGKQLKLYMSDKYIDVSGNKLSKKAIDEMIEINLYKLVEKIKANVCTIHGTEDEVVPPYTSVKIKELLGSQCELQLIEGADHWYATIEHEQQLISVIVKYCQKNIC